MPLLKNGPARMLYGESLRSRPQPRTQAADASAMADIPPKNKTTGAPTSRGLVPRKKKNLFHHFACR